VEGEGGGSGGGGFRGGGSRRSRKQVEPEAVVFRQRRSWRRADRNREREKRDGSECCDDLCMASSKTWRGSNREGVGSSDDPLTKANEWTESVVPRSGASYVLGGTSVPGGTSIPVPLMRREGHSSFKRSLGVQLTIATAEYPGNPGWRDHSCMPDLPVDLPGKVYKHIQHSLDIGRREESVEKSPVALPYHELGGGLLGNGEGNELSEDALREAMWIGTAEIRGLIEGIRGRGYFCGSSLRRVMRKQLAQQLAPESFSSTKPKGLSINEMFDDDMARAGREVLPPGTHRLQPEAMRSLHAETCTTCQSPGGGECYFHAMVRCIECGWMPTLVRPIVPQYTAEVNGRNAMERYPERFKKETTKTREAGFVQESPGPMGSGGLWHPCNMAVKGSDLSRARIHTGVVVVDQASLDAANLKLQELDMVEVKCRLTTNCSAGGLNDAALKPAFSSPGVDDALRFIERGDWLAKGDVATYYPMFPLAEEARQWFHVSFEAILMCYVVVCFGFAPAAYYASMWSAELRRWVIGRGVGRVVHMMDDWLVASRTEGGARSDMDTIKQVLALAGFLMVASKFDCGQQLLFLGIRINTVTMCLAFDQDQCKAMELDLRAACREISKGHLPSYARASHIAGKLTWFGGILQSGRLRTASWWSSTRYGDKLSSALQTQLLVDSQWWIDVLKKWGEGEESELSFPILSSSELMNDPGRVYVVQSDFGGSEGDHPGSGYIHGYLTGTDPGYTTWRWKSGDETGHSTWGELSGLLRFLREHVEGGIAFREGVLIWISDSASGVFMANAGTCRDPECFPVLDAILSICDEYRIQLVGIWVPRERNQLADYLSHLSHRLNLDRLDGHVSSLAGCGGQGAGGGPE
jgi:hypothetical protein